jgi:MFS family permease
VLASVGAAVQGWDQTGSNGANLGFPVEFGIPEDPGPGVSELQAQSNQWIVGLVNSGPYFGAAFFGCWLNDPMNNWLGRRGTIFISAVFCLITPIGSAVSQN